MEKARCFEVSKQLGGLESYPGVEAHQEPMAWLHENLPTLRRPRSTRGHKSFDVAFPDGPSRCGRARTGLKGRRGPRSRSKHRVYSCRSQLRFPPGNPIAQLQILDVLPRKKTKSCLATSCDLSGLVPRRDPLLSVR